MKSLQDGYELREHRSMPTQQSRDDERHLRRENVIGEEHPGRYRCVHTIEPGKNGFQSLATVADKLLHVGLERPGTPPR